MPGTTGVDLYPQHLRADIDALNDQVRVFSLEQSPGPGYYPDRLKYVSLEAFAAGVASSLFPFKHVPVCLELGPLQPGL